MNFRRIFCFSMLLFVVVGPHCARKELPPPSTVASLDVDRYMGVWHEIARLPFPFEEDCFGASAKYEAINEEEFLITNYCWKKSFFGPMQRAHAKAWVDDMDQKSKLKVSFFWPFAGDYWVLYVDADYRTALVGTPDRKYLWIMSRDFQMPDDDYQALVRLAEEKGFDVSKLIRTPQKKTERSDAVDESAGTGDAGVADGGKEGTDPKPTKWLYRSNEGSGVSLLGRNCRSIRCFAAPKGMPLTLRSKPNGRPRKESGAPDV
jgi:apolipoprotein D and lipocalin family protein